MACILYAKWFFELLWESQVKIVPKMLFVPNFVIFCSINRSKIKKDTEDVQDLIIFSGSILAPRQGKSNPCPLVFTLILRSTGAKWRRTRTTVCSVLIFSSQRSLPPPPLSRGVSWKQSGATVWEGSGRFLTKNQSRQRTSI